MDKYLSKDKDLVNRVRFSTSCDKQLLKSIKKLSKDTMIPLSKLIDKGIKYVLEEYKYDDR